MSGSTTGVFIGGLPAASAVSTADIFPLVQGATIGTPGTGTTRYATVAHCLANVPPGADSYPVLANIAALTTYSGPALVVFVAGYYTSADGGQGSFYLNGGDTTSVSEGGTIIVSNQGQRWFRDTINSGVYSVAWFGAIAGVGDSTPKIQACVNAAQARGCSVYFPGSPAVYTVSGPITITAPGEIFGDCNTSQIQTTSAVSDIFLVTGSFVTIHDLVFSSAAATQTAGAFIDLKTVSNIQIYNCAFNGWFFGIYASALFISILRIDECKFNSGAPSTGIGIQINAGANIYITNIVHDAPSPGPFPLAAINIPSCADVTIRGAGIDHANTGLLLNPQSGQFVNSVYCTDCFFDQCGQYGMLVYGTGTGAVLRSRFVGCWFSSNGIDGVAINNPATGTVSGLEFVGCHIFGNTANGVYLAYGLNYTFTGCQVAGNGTAAISLTPGISNVTVVGCTLGPSGGFGPNQYGMFISAGPSDHYIVANNQLQGNSTSPFINGGTGSDTITTPNLL